MARFYKGPKLEIGYKIIRIEKLITLSIIIK